MIDSIRVECPDCAATFETCDAGDVVICEGCGEPFNRFMHVVDDDPEDEEYVGETVECTVCGETVGRGPGGFGLTQHAGKHRRDFRLQVGRPPKSYQEVRDRLGGRKSATGDAQLTLAEALDDRARDARRDDDQSELAEGSK